MKREAESYKEPVVVAMAVVDDFKETVLSHSRAVMYMNSQ